MDVQTKLPASMAVTAGELPLRLDVLISRAGRDITMYIGGGTAPHIGSVVISQPRESLSGSGHRSCTTSVYNLLGHKDDQIAVLFAEAFCKKYGIVVVVSAGMHIDKASPSELKKILSLARRLLKKSLTLWDG
jgi:hypothetical protein